MGDNDDQGYSAHIQIPEYEHGKLVTNRVACRSATGSVFHSALEVEADAIKGASTYRMRLLLFMRSLRDRIGLHAMTDEQIWLFQDISNFLHVSRSVAFPVRIGTDTDGHIGNELVVDDLAHTLLDPLCVALSAYYLGGTVNGAHTLHKSEWKPPDFGADVTPNQYYIEGDTGSPFDGLRLSLVWESRKGADICELSGIHNVFLSGDATPHTIPNLSPAPTMENGANALLILYDTQHAALSYYTEDLEATRRSLSVDLHRSSVTDEDVEFLSSSNESLYTKRPDLVELITRFPRKGYATLFNEVVFSKASLLAMTRNFSTFLLPEVALPKDGNKRAVKQRYDTWVQDNKDHRPTSISCMQNDLRVVGTYPSIENFISHLSRKACRDIHLFLGMDLVPHSPVDEHREFARRFFRDYPEELVRSRLSKYTKHLTEHPYDKNSILTTEHIHQLAYVMERSCLDLIGAGYVDTESSCLSSVAALASALGKAMHGAKEIDNHDEPWYNDFDLCIYRTRCLYLFWCADSLLCYLLKFQEGPFMMNRGPLQQEQVHARLGWRILSIANDLLRNWVAWGLFMDILLAKLPDRKFCVRRTRADSVTSGGRV